MAIKVLSGALGPQKTLVLVMAPPGGSVSATQATVDAVMAQVDAAYRNASANQTFFVGVKAPSAKCDTFFYTLKTFNPSACGASTNTTEAEQAAGAAGYTLSQYSRVIGLVPDQACQAHGLSGIGSRYAMAVGPNQVTFRVLAHEIGHSFGYYHSGVETCNAYLDCGYSEYGDSPDVMSNSGGSDFNGFERERAGWAQYPVVGFGSYDVAPFNDANAPANSKAIKIAIPGTSRFYYVTNRPERGGFLVHRADENDPASSRWITWLSVRGDGILKPGDMLDDYVHGIYITTDGSKVNVSNVHPGLPQGFAFAAPKYQNVIVPAGKTATVAYGAKSQFQFLPNISGTLSCPQGTNQGGSDSACFIKLDDGVPPPPPPPDPDPVPVPPPPPTPDPTPTPVPQPTVASIALPSSITVTMSDGTVVTVPLASK